MRRARAADSRFGCAAHTGSRHGFDRAAIGLPRALDHPVGGRRRISPARAVPAFAVQTSQPCAACHVGAFGPQLKPFGRDFKLHGYVGNDGQDHGLPLAATVNLLHPHRCSRNPAVPRPASTPTTTSRFDAVSFYLRRARSRPEPAASSSDHDGVAGSPTRQRRYPPRRRGPAVRPGSALGPDRQ